MRPPRDEIESQLALLWQEILETGPVGIDDNFFELGGHSLRGVVMVSRIHQIFNREMPLRGIFNHPTIRGQAAILKKTGKSIFASIQPVDRVNDYPSGYYPASSAQKRLLILNQFEGAQTSYNMPGALMIEGKLDRARLETVFQTLIARHESFRTSFEIQNGEPVQRIWLAAEVAFHLEGADSNPRVQDSNLRLQDIIRAFIRPFDLSHAPLLRAGLVQLSGSRHLLIYDLHHIIADGLSIEILVQEFMDLYGGGQLPKLCLQYKDYAVWQNQALQTGAIKLQEEYWLSRFAAEIPVLNWRTDFPRPAVQSFEGAQISFELEPEFTRKIHRLSSQTGVTLYMILLSAFYTLLFKYTGQEDLVIGSPVAGRSHPDLERIIGMFVNTLAMRNYPAGAKTFADFLVEVKDNAIQAFENQDYQFEELVEKLNIQRDLSRNPLFDVVFVLQNTFPAEREADGLRFIPYPVESQTAKFDLLLQATGINGKIAFVFEYSAKLFKPETVQRLAGHYLMILQRVAENPSLSLAGIELLTPEEKKRILEDFNDTMVDFPKTKMIHELFAAQAAKTPGRIAVVFQEKQLTYHLLNQKANYLAGILKNRGVAAGSIVGLLAERGLEMIVGIIGILKAGAAYLPIEPKYPDARIEYLLKDCQTDIMVTQTAWERRLPPGITVVNLADLDITGNCREELPNPAPGADSNLPAYIMYTSGSTGAPKGVIVTHRNVIRLVINPNYIAFNEEDRILLTGAPVFDATTFEIWSALFNGLSLYLAPDEVILDAGKLGQALQNYRITTLWLTSSLFNQLSGQNPELFSGLRYLLVGGDVLAAKHINRIRKQYPDLTVINGYGPTENTTFSTCFQIDQDYEDNIPIGGPISNSTAYIVNSEQKLQPVGIPGELFVGGEGVALGYLNHPELTAEKFVVRAFRESPPREGLPPVEGQPQRIYRTGDLARWLPDGNIDFLGRIDSQVKIRGFRIELGEIEARLLQHEAVKTAAVLVKEDADRNKYLCAYLATDAPAGERKLTHQELRTHLSGTLPDYMIPAYFIQMEELPLTVNGKVDRKVLARISPGPELEGQLNSQVDYVAPRNEIEAGLAVLWQEILGIQKAGIDDNFFELGGHSLKATIIVSRIHQLFNIETPLREVFQNQTIRGLAAYLETQIAKQEQLKELEAILAEIEGMQKE